MNQREVNLWNDTLECVDSLNFNSGVTGNSGINGMSGTSKTSGITGTSVASNPPNTPNTSTSHSSSSKKEVIKRAIHEFESNLGHWSKAQFNAGILYLRLKNYHQSIYCFTKSLKLDEYLALGYFCRAFAYFKLKEYEMSIQDYEKCLEVTSTIHLLYCSLWKYQRLI